MDIGNIYYTIGPTVSWEEIVHGPVRCCRLGHLHQRLCLQKRVYLRVLWRDHLPGRGGQERKGVRQVHVLLPLQPQQRVRGGRHQKGEQDQIRQSLHQPQLLRQGTISIVYYVTKELLCS